MRIHLVCSQGRRVIVGAARLYKHGTNVTLEGLLWPK